MIYKYGFGEAIEWEIDEDEGMFVFSIRDYDEDDWGPFDMHVYINNFDWQDEDPPDPEADTDSWYLDDYKIYKIEFYTEDGDKVTEEELMKKFGVTKENLECLKDTADSELGHITMGIWMDYFGVHVKIENN